MSVCLSLCLASVRHSAVCSQSVCSLCLTCLSHVSASRVCLTCLSHVSVSRVCLMCLPHVSVSRVCHVPVLRVCLTCLLHVSASRVSPLSTSPSSVSTNQKVHWYVHSKGWGWCLNDEPAKHEFKYPTMLPGLLYDADHQCRLQYGPSSSHCVGVAVSSTLLLQRSY